MSDWTGLMKLTADIGGAIYRVDLSAGVDISIPVDFKGPQPNLYDVPAASSRAYREGSFVGDTREGGNCNFEELRIVPHCNGTHTECIGHLTHDRRYILDTLQESLIPCIVASVSPVGAADTAETALDSLSPENLVVTRQDVEKHLRNAPEEFRRCLVVRTFPNHRSKRSQRYGDRGAAFFSRAAIKALVDHNVTHLITDLPSVDPLDDGGIMMGHRLFWGIDEDSHDIMDESNTMKTITELVYIPDSVEDGTYVVNLQVAPLQSDASPSRPILYPVEIV